MQCKTFTISQSHLSQFITRTDNIHNHSKTLAQFTTDTATCPVLATDTTHSQSTLLTHDQTHSLTKPIKSHQHKINNWPIGVTDTFLKQEVMNPFHNQSDSTTQQETADQIHHQASQQNQFKHIPQDLMAFSPPPNALTHKHTNSLIPPPHPPTSQQYAPVA